MRFVTNIGSRLATLCNNLEILEELQGEITAGDGCGVQLEVVSVTTRIRVVNTVWETEGLSLESLAEHLR